MLSLHSRISQILGWTEAETTRFPLTSLRELVRPVSPSLANELTEIIQSGTVIKERVTVDMSWLFAK